MVMKSKGQQVETQEREYVNEIQTQSDEGIPSCLGKLVFFSIQAFD